MYLLYLIYIYCIYSCWTININTINKAPICSQLHSIKAKSQITRIIHDPLLISIFFWHLLGCLIYFRYDWYTETDEHQQISFLCTFFSTTTVCAVLPSLVRFVHTLWWCRAIVRWIIKCLWLLSVRRYDWCDF